MIQIYEMQYNFATNLKVAAFYVNGFLFYGHLRWCILMRQALPRRESVTKKKAQITYSAQVLICLMHIPLNVLTKQRKYTKMHVSLSFSIILPHIFLYSLLLFVIQSSIING